jgi:signal transduction histidine kinase
MIRAMARRRSSSIRLPILLSSITVVLSAALLVGWIYVILKNFELTRQWRQGADPTLLVAGIVSFIVIITVLVLFSVFLAREIREVRIQTNFVDSVTHELRSPLASIRLALETLGRSEVDERQRADLREMMLHDTERLASFIDDILEVNRLGHGDGAREVGEVSLRSVIAESVAVITRRHRVPLETISVEIAHDIQLTTGPTALGIVVRNLLDNAVKYSDPPYDVRVRAELGDRDEVAISVSDTGVGIRRRDLKRIFERFYRVPDASTRRRRGAGLGLFLASALVRSLGGKLRAHSDGPGTGTRIDVVVPRAGRHRGGTSRIVEHKAPA